MELLLSDNFASSDILLIFPILTSHKLTVKLPLDASNIDFGQ